MHLVDVADQMALAVKALKSDARSRDSEEREAFPDEVLLMLTLSDIAFDVVERGNTHVDVLISESRSIVPTTLFCSASAQAPTKVALDAVWERAHSHAHVTQYIIVVPDAVENDLVHYATRRGLQLVEYSQLRNELFTREQRDAVILGRLPSERLAASLNISDLFVEQHAHHVTPTGWEHSPAPSNIQLRELFQGFLGRSSRMLVVLGDYGSGKSAWCAQMLKEFQGSDAAYAPVLLLLRHVKEPSDLPTLVKRTVSLAKQHSPGRPVLLIADGLDEMPNALQPKERRQNVLRLLEAAIAPDKMVVTARASYFRGLGDFWSLFATGEEAGLWRRMAEHISPDKSRPQVEAVMLEEFNNSSIDSYVRGSVRLRGGSEDDVAQFLTSLEENDPHNLYRRLARNPLYLFLLVNTEPWKDSSVACVADVVNLVLRYWLERDIEKGASRWLLTAHDRREFMAALATEMFNNNEHAVSFSRFDDFVKRYYRISDFDREGAALALDLQTTGVFGSSGGALHFSLPAVYDLLISEQIHLTYNHTLLERLPSVDQARLWLGTVETRNIDYNVLVGGPRPYWLRKWAINCGFPLDYPRCSSIAVDPRGIVYNVSPDTWSWPWTNNQDEIVIGLANYLLEARHPDVSNVVRAVVLTRYGLHARPSAYIVNAYYKWLAGLHGPEKPKVRIHAKGIEANAGSIMEIMLLAAERGTILTFAYTGCSEAEFARFILLAGFSSRADPDVPWAFDWDPSESRPPSDGVKREMPT
jgi:phosphotransferase system HPr (HPr) family protein